MKIGVTKFRNKNIYISDGIHISRIQQLYEGDFARM